MGTIHFLDVGWGDASVIKTASATFLVDCHNIEDYDEFLPENNHIRGVFVTHQHDDHYSGLRFLKDNGYSIDHLIFCPYKRRRGDNSVDLDDWNEFNSLKDYFEGQGTKLHKPYRQGNFEKPWWETNGVKFWMIGPVQHIADAETRELHDASLVIIAHLGERRCLFTGDASDQYLEHIAENTKNYCNDILHASHHGSLNGAQLDFIKECKAKYTIISTETGIYENAPHPTALKRYKDNTGKVYRTDEDGTLKVEF